MTAEHLSATTSAPDQRAAAESGGSATVEPDLPGTGQEAEE